MNFLEKIEEIKKVFINNGFIDLSNDILGRQISGGTGGEVLIGVCSKLLEIKRVNLPAFKLIEPIAKQLISYCHSLGIYPE
jgi:hypothetical protein